MSGPCTDCGGPDYQKLEVRVAELEAEVQHQIERREEEKLRAVNAEVALPERDKESTDLLDAIFQTVDPEDGEEIVAEAFPNGGPAWVLAWYQEHPNEEELRVRAAPYPKHVCYLCHSPIQPDQESEEWEPGYRHFECPVRAEEGSENE